MSLTEWVSLNKGIGHFIFPLVDRKDKCQKESFYHLLSLKRKGQEYPGRCYHPSCFVIPYLLKFSTFSCAAIHVDAYIKNMICSTVHLQWLPTHSSITWTRIFVDSKDTGIAFSFWPCTNRQCNRDESDEYKQGYTTILRRRHCSNPTGR